MKKKAPRRSAEEWVSDNTFLIAVAILAAAFVPMILMVTP